MKTEDIIITLILIAIFCFIGTAFYFSDKSEQRKMETIKALVQQGVPAHEVACILK